MARYTLLFFLPRNLIEQFKRLANFYFLVLVGIQVRPRASCVCVCVGGLEFGVVPLLTGLVASDGC